MCSVSKLCSQGPAYSSRDVIFGGRRDAGDKGRLSIGGPPVGCVYESRRVWERDDGLWVPFVPAVEKDTAGHVARGDCGHRRPNAEPGTD